MVVEMRFSGMGCDPDLHTMSFATVVIEAPDRYRLRSVDVVRVPDDVKEDDAVKAMIDRLRGFFDRDGSYCNFAAVENQMVYERQRNHDDIVRLAQVAGFAFGHALHKTGATSATFFPKPGEWKGQVPKNILGARILGRCGIEYVQQKTFSKPSKKALASMRGAVVGVEDVGASDWQHVVDAIGLAQWSLKEGIRP